MAKAPRTAFKPGQSGNPNGRPKGVIGYRDVLTIEERVRMATEAGCTPLQFMISIMLDPTHPMADRLDMAKAAAPYMHRKMPIAVELPPNLAPTFDVEKLAALPVEERKLLLVTLGKLGVNLGTLSSGPTGMPTPAEVAASMGKVATALAKADVAGRPAPGSIVGSYARAGELKRKTAGGRAVTINPDFTVGVAPHPNKGKPKPVGSGRKKKVAE